MKKILVALVALVPFIAFSAHAKMTHKWDEEHYTNGKFQVKKHDYPKKRSEAADSGAALDGTVEHNVKVDHKGRIYKEADFPPPRNHGNTKQ